MTASTITSIKDYIQLKKTATGSPEPIRRVTEDIDRSSDRPEKNDRLEKDIPENIRFDQPIVRHHDVGLRFTIKNRLALNTRRTDQTMHQISIRIGLIKDGLNALAKYSSPYPINSENRTAGLHIAKTRQMEIEQLTLSPPTDDNAPDAQINMSIRRLREADDFIGHQRRRLKIEAMLLLFRESGSPNDTQSAEAISRFIAKHLSHHPDSDLTTLPSPFTGYLNSPWP
jgi:hypothetical protein